VEGLVRSLVVHGQIRTTHARAREAQRLADRLVSWGKEGSIHARRRAFRILQDRTLVKRLFTEVAPRFVDIAGGYTRVLRLSTRRGDGAQQAVLALSRRPAAQPAPTAGPKPAGAARPPPPRAETPKEPKGFLEGLRRLWSRGRRGEQDPAERRPR